MFLATFELQFAGVMGCEARRRPKDLSSRISVYERAQRVRRDAQNRAALLATQRARKLPPANLHGSETMEDLPPELIRVAVRARPRVDVREPRRALGSTSSLKMRRRYFAYFL